MTVSPFLDVLGTEAHVATDFHVRDAPLGHEAPDHAFWGCEPPGGLGCRPQPSTRDIGLGLYRRAVTLTAGLLGIGCDGHRSSQAMRRFSSRPAAAEPASQASPAVRWPTPW